jgi:hypothetical protein
LIEATRQQYEQTISEKDQEIAQREEAGKRGFLAALSVGI